MFNECFDWAFSSIDPDSIKASVDTERQKNPKLSNAQLASKAFSRARWKATAAGCAAGAAANPWAAAPAAITDLAITLKTLVSAAARTAIIYDPDFFAEDDNKYELLIPLLGIHGVGQAVQKVAVRGGMGVTRASIKKYLSKETLKSLKKLALKYFGLKVTQKGMITKTLPVIGIALGGGWNFVEVGIVKNRTIRYFEAP